MAAELDNIRNRGSVAPMTTDFHPCEAEAFEVPCGKPSTTSLGFHCDNCGPLSIYACGPHGETLAALAQSRPDKRRDHRDGTSNGCGGRRTVMFLEAVYLDSDPVPSSYADMLRSL